MALVNPSGLYNSTPALNPLPYVNIALQARQRKQAREDAIDKYYTDLPNKINDKGVRDQEIPVINSLKTQMSDYYVKNKAAINNPNLDNGAARHGLDLLFRKTDATAAESKNRLKTDLQLGKWRFNKEKEYIFKNPNFIKIHEAHTLPIGTEGSQSIDIASLDVPPKPLDLNSVRKDLKQFKYSEGTPTVTEHPTDKTLEVVTSNPIFKDEDKKSLYDYGATRLHSDPSFEEFIKNGLPNTGLLPNLVEIAKKQFGVKDATEISDEDLAAAFLYSQLPTSQTKAKVIPSFTNREAGKIAAAKDKAYLNDALIRGRMKLAQSYKMAYKDYTAGVDAAQDEKVLNTFLRNTIGSGVVGNVELGGEKINGVFADLPKDISKKYVANVTDPSDPKYTIEKEPDSWFFTEDNKFAIPLYYEDPSKKSGNLITNPNQKPVSMQNIKVDLAKLLLGQKQRGGEVIDQFDVSEPPTQPTKQAGKATPAKTKTVTVTSSKQTIPGF